MEDLALDGTALQGRAFGSGHPVETGAEELAEGGRDHELGETLSGCPASIPSLEQALVDQHADELLDEERVPRRRGGDSFRQARR